MFADFTPAATNRGLYANTDLQVVPSAQDPATAKADQRADVIADYLVTLTPASQPLRAKQVIDLAFAITHRNGGPVPLLPVMDAYALLRDRGARAAASLTAEN